MVTSLSPFVSDALSRAPIPVNISEISPDEIAYHVHTVINSIPISNTRLLQFQNETKTDEILQKVKNYVLYGWPDKQSVDIDVAPYYPFKHEISFNYDLLLKGLRIIVPHALRREVKSMLHEGHLGIECCKRRARRSVFWPGLNKEIVNLVSSCQECLTHRNRLTPEPLMKHDVPEEPWIKVATDLFTIYGKDYVIVIDYCSKYFEVALVKNPVDSPAVVKEMKKIFSRHGIPKIVFSDNGPQYTSREFKQFAKEWDFDHQFSSPYFPQSNGLVERKIQTVKRTIKKVYESDGDIYLAILALNTTPDEENVSPSEKMYKRQPRSTLIELSYGKYNQTNSVHRTKETKGKNLPEIDPGTTVRIRTAKDKNWNEQGRVLSKCAEPRAYRLINSKGNIIRRNRVHIIPTKERFENIIDYDELEIPQRTLLVRTSDNDNKVNVDDKGEDNNMNVSLNSPVQQTVVSDEVSHNNSNKIYEEERNVTEETSTRTRSGRMSKLPKRYIDYEM